MRSPIPDRETEEHRDTWRPLTALGDCPAAAQTIVLIYIGQSCTSIRPGPCRWGWSNSQN